MPYGDCTGPDGRGPRRRLFGRVGDLFRGRNAGYGYDAYYSDYGYRRWQGGYGRGRGMGGRGQGRRGGRMGGRW